MYPFVVLSADRLPFTAPSIVVGARRVHAVARAAWSGTKSEAPNPLTHPQKLGATGARATPLPGASASRDAPCWHKRSQANRLISVRRLLPDTKML